MRELHALDEDLLAIGVEDGLATLLRGCPAQELSIEALEATAQALIDEAGRQREVEEAARLERQAREDALLAPYSEEIGRMVAEWFRHNGSSGSWASRAAEARKRAVERAIRTHLLERGTFPAGTTEVEYEFFGPRRFLVDFDRLRGAP